MTSKDSKYISLSQHDTKIDKHISAMEAHFTKYGLDQEVVDHLWYLPAASIHGIEGKPRLDKTLKDVYEGIRRDHANLNSPEETSAIARNIGMSQKEMFEADALLFELLFKGVNKNALMPIIATNVNLGDLRQERTLTTAHGMVYLTDSDHVNFSPKNLVKYYRYSEAEAKVFFKNAKSTPLLYQYETYRLVKPKSCAYFRNCFSLNHSTPPMWMWSFSQSYKEREAVECDMSSDYQKALDLTDRPLPSFSLSAWKEVARLRYDRLNPASNWDELSVENQKRMCVNAIRHNSVSYVQSWSLANPEHIKYLHDISFDRTMRKIIKLYPYLADECRRQLDSRSIPLEPKLIN